MTMSEETQTALLAMNIRPGHYAYVHFDGRYWDHKGLAPDGSLRVYARRRPPYRRPVNYITGSVWKTGRARAGVHPAVPIFLAAALLVLAVSLAFFAHRANPGLWQGGRLLSALLAVGAVGAFILPPGVRSDGWDDQRLIAGPAQTYEEYLQEEHAGDPARRSERWQKAQWAQQVSIDQALNPGRDVNAPYGQYPPL